MTKREKKQGSVTDRDRKRIASRFPILTPMQEGDPDYWVKHDGSVALIERFDPTKEVEALQKIKAFELAARLDAIQSGEEQIELAIAGDAIRTLLEDVAPSLLVSDIQFAVAQGFLPRRVQVQPSPELVGFSGFLFSLAGTRKLDSARLVIWVPRTGTAGPAMLCPNNETAAFVSLAFSRLFSGLRACLQCGRIFLPNRLDQDYHDRRCADLHRKRRKATREKMGGEQ